MPTPPKKAEPPKPTPKPDAKRDQKEPYSKPGGIDAPNPPSNLPAVSHSNDPVNAPRNKAGQPVKEAEVPKGKDGKPLPTRSWE